MNAASDMDTEMEIERDSTSTRETMNQNEGLRNLLTLARRLINEGKPSLALQAVVAAVKSDGGDVAVIQILNRARELYINKLQASSAADELAALFAECAIAEAQPLRPEQSGTNTGIPPNLSSLDANGSSILAKAGRKQVVLDAFSDGSSFVCLRCGGLVSNHRKEEHEAYWCCQI